MTLSLAVDLDDPTPPYEQIRRQLTHLVGTGQLAPGDRLPPLRQLARDLGLAVGTVGRSYAELEADGLLTSRRGAGTRVSDRPPVAAGDALGVEAAAYVARVTALGASPPDVLEAVRRALLAAAGAGNARPVSGVRPPSPAVGRLASDGRG